MELLRQALERRACRDGCARMSAERGTFSTPLRAEVETQAEIEAELEKGTERRARNACVDGEHGPSS